MDGARCVRIAHARTARGAPPFDPPNRRGHGPGRCTRLRASPMLEIAPDVLGALPRGSGRACGRACRRLIVERAAEASRPERDGGDRQRQGACYGPGRAGRRRRAHRREEVALHGVDAVDLRVRIGPIDVPASVHGGDAHADGLAGLARRQTNAMVCIAVAKLWIVLRSTGSSMPAPRVWKSRYSIEAGGAPASSAGARNVAMR